jgi:hypothetical protein
MNDKEKIHLVRLSKSDAHGETDHLRGLRELVLEN